MQAAIAARAQAATAWERARLNQTAEAARQALVGELHAAARDSAAVDQASQALLRNVLAQADRANTSWFDAVKVSLDLPPSLLARGDGRGMAGKATVGLASLRQHGGTCTAYGAGVRYEGGTELQLARSGCAVHAFDCTMNSSARMHKYLSAFAALPNFAFHPWCLGTAPGRADFMAVDDTMRSLGHRWLDLLKFDIEGHEWDVLDSLLTRAEGDAAAAARLPLQLAFELHTSGVRPCHRPLSACRGTFCCKRVPHMAVGTLLSKGPREVAALFLRLREAGYQVASKEVNVQDRACAEFVVVRVPPPPEAAAPAVADGRGTPSAAPTPARAVAASTQPGGHRARCFAGTHEPEPYHNATPRYSALDQLPDRPSDGGAAVCGCAQGIERHIPRAARAMEEMAAAFAWARIVVMENDSGDGTLAALHQWAARSPNVTILTERGVMARRSSVYQRMSHCRNLLLSHARKLAPAWVVMYDPDLRTTPSAAGFLSCFSLRPVGWAVCGANTPTSQPYYDLLALRTLDDWMPGDYKSCKRRCPQPVCHGANRVIPNESEPVEVLSLFGGLAIYRFALLDGCWYDEAAQQCEHVAFNRCLRRRNGGRLYINPRLQVQR